SFFLCYNSRRLPREGIAPLPLRICFACLPGARVRRYQWCVQALGSAPHVPWSGNLTDGFAVCRIVLSFRMEVFIYGRYVWSRVGVQLCAGPVLRNRLSFPSGDEARWNGC